jgi:hypothetical protein
MNWHDTLCGAKITPEAWVGGIVTGTPGMSWLRNTWATVTQLGDRSIQNRLSTDIERHLCPNWVRPIFPPRGWAGKTDAELWQAVFGDGSYPPKYGYGVLQPHAANVVLCHFDGTQITQAQTTPDGIKARDFADAILALQNAQVLAGRLA